ncbi:hypothetical protein ACFWTC_23005 [Streptomyces sp. NPDC058619]|uniref:hypothetical protein n=1 Tax=Streptomyces sp. NPDC058619 TaxID=3346559 RepID=UPI003665C911
MNDPITLAATDHEDRPGIPDTTAPDAFGQEPVRTLLEAAATCRPLEEVTALVSLLNDTGQSPNPGHEALRTAAVTRPVDEVRQMVALLGEHPHEVVEADITLRAAAVGRSIEDVALLVTILGAGEADGSGAPDQAPAGSAERPGEGAEPPAERYEPGYTELYDAPYAEAPARPVPYAEPRTRPAAPQAPPRSRQAPAARPEASPALRHVLRWPVALALLVSGALHLPADLTALSSASPAGFLPLVVTVLCLGAGSVLAARDTPLVWRAGAVTALGVVALHVFGGAAHYDPLTGAVGGSLAWAGVLAVFCAAAGAVLAGLALRNRQERSA